MKETLRALYGDSAADQQGRYEAAMDAFVECYGPGEIAIFRSPGRVNLIGEHTDYNHGYVLPLALEQDILLLARARQDEQVRLRNFESDFAPLSFSISTDIPPGPAGDWGNYARGTAQRLAREYGPLAGFDGLVVGAPPHGLPRGAGLSSSSALTVAVAVTLLHFNEGNREWGIGNRGAWSAARPGPTPYSLAHLCADAEWYVGTRGGMMDHFIALLGRRDHALFLDCRPDAEGQYQTRHIRLPEGYVLLVANSGIRHQNARGQYNHRVAACRAGVQLLRSHFPGITHLRDVQEVPWEQLSPHLPEDTTVGELCAEGIELSDLPGLTSEINLRVRARCRHVWTENRRVLQAVEALESGEADVLGDLLDEAHASARDDYEVSCPELETLTNLLRQQPGVLGARLTGAGWGGCAVALVEAVRAESVAREAAARYQTATGTSSDFFSCRPGQGAGIVMSVEP